MSEPQNPTDGFRITELALDVETIRELSDRSSNVAGRFDCTQKSECDCHPYQSWATYYFGCCDC